jgi:hypothetical protein
VLVGPAAAAAERRRPGAGYWWELSLRQVEVPAPPQGLVARIPHTNTYTLTPDGLRVAVFYTKIHDRLLRPLLAADQPTPRSSSAGP